MQNIFFWNILSFWNICFYQT